VPSTSAASRSRRLRKVQSQARHSSWHFSTFFPDEINRNPRDRILAVQSSEGEKRTRIGCRLVISLIESRQNKTPSPMLPLRVNFLRSRNSGMIAAPRQIGHAADSYRRKKPGMHRETGWPRWCRIAKLRKRRGTSCRGSKASPRTLKTAVKGSPLPRDGCPEEQNLPHLPYSPTSSAGERW